MDDNNLNQGAKQAINEDSIRCEIENSFKAVGTIKHCDVFQEILDNLNPIDFEETANLSEEGRITQKIQVVLTVQEVLRVTQELNCGLCRHLDFIYAFNGEFWQLIDRDDLSTFLGDVNKHEKMTH